jgi:hypothetical protein
LLGLTGFGSFNFLSPTEISKFILHPFFDGEICSERKLLIARGLGLIFVFIKKPNFIDKS